MKSITVADIMNLNVMKDCAKFHFCHNRLLPTSPL